MTEQHGRRFMALLLCLMLPTVSDAEQYKSVGRIGGAVDAYPLAHSPYSSDGRLLVTTAENQLRVWNTETCEAVTKPLIHNSLDYYRISADGKSIFSAGGKDVKLWDVATSTLQLQHRVSNDQITFADCSADALDFISVSSEYPSELICWAFASGKLTIGFRRDFTAKILSGEFDPSGKWIIIQTVHGQFHVLKTATGEDTCKAIEPDPEYNPHSIQRQVAQFDPSGKRRLLIPRDDGFTLIDPSDGKIISRTGIKSRPTDLMRFSPDGDFVSITTWGIEPATHSSLLIVECRTGKTVYRAEGNIMGCQLSSRGEQALITIDDQARTVKLVDVASGKTLQVFSMARSGHAIFPEMSPSGGVIAMESGSAVSTIWRDVIKDENKRD